MSKQLQLQHLLWRFGFGPAAQDWPSWQSLEPNAWWTKLKKESNNTPLVALEAADSALKGLLMGIGEADKMNRKELSDEEKKQLRRQSREDLRSLNALWLQEICNTKAQLREKMAFFWHGHFASRNFNVLYQQQLLHIIRIHATGNLGDLLRGVSKSAAMLAFLNNQQNKKKKPNENFAREVMELFTLGRGNYTEQDVREAARAFTGWGFELDGTFIFRKFQHDTGTKTFLGQTGNFDGDDILNILLEQPQTARFITAKLYRFLVNDTDVPQARIEQLATTFKASGYNIMALLDAIATSNWFYETENIGRKIKSPIELWAGLRRALCFQPVQPEGELLVQKALGQMLFYPPNVAGWPGGRSWIDTSSLLLRLRLPQMLAAGTEWEIQGKDNDDEQMGQKRKPSAMDKKLAATLDFLPLEKIYNLEQEQELPKKIARFLWQIPQQGLDETLLGNFTRRGNRQEYIRSLVVQLMATPEYQLC